MEEEITVEENEKRNEKFLEEFEEWLKKKKLGDKTIRKHIENIDFYLNCYLTHYDVTKMEDGYDEVYFFLNDYFIRKTTWASKYTLKENAASLKKFYLCMMEKGYVKKEDYKELCDELKENMDDFLEHVDEYNNELLEYF